MNMSLEQVHAFFQEFFAQFSAIKIEYLLIIGALLILVFLIIMLAKEMFMVVNLIRKLFINSILGFLIWGICYYYLKIELPFFASLIVSVIFGIAGIGTLLILKFLGLI